MKTSLLTLTFLLFAQLTFGQSYSLWVTGDSADVETNHKQSIVLAGGGGDHDEGMRWMLRKAERKVAATLIYFRRSTACPLTTKRN